MTEPRVPRLRLLPLTPGQASRLAAYDDGVLAEIGGVRPGPGWPHDDTVHAFAFCAVGGRTWLVVDGDDVVIGELGTKGPPGPDGIVEIGYGLAAPSRGRGLGTVAVRLLLTALASDPAAQRVRAHVAADNLASGRLLERLGFVACGAAADGEVRYERPLRVDLPDPRR